jgi:hypothetical protein
MVGTSKQFPTKRLAIRELEKRLSVVNSEDYRPRQPATFAQFRELWKAAVLTQHEPSSQSSEKSDTNRVLVPYFGPISLKDINAAAVQRFVSTLDGAPKIVRNLVTTLRLVWKTAQTWGYVQHEPFHGLRMPESTKSATYNFTMEETLAIIAARPSGGRLSSGCWLRRGCVPESLRG